jgi:type II secretory ATPase GspE/PulE/Tfp pilus assembly ATPase PilB-like protein
MEETYLMDMIIADAYLKGASGVLFDSSVAHEASNVLFRMDGVMKEYMTIPGDVAKYIIKRLKWMAKLDVKDNCLSKIGRIIFKHKGLPEFHLQVTICTAAGLREKATLRIQAA